MTISADLRERLSKANRLENRGAHRRAGRAYLDVISRLGEDERVDRGVIHINLSTNAWSAGRHRDAFRFAEIAIDLLEGEKGEAFLQRAYAVRNLAMWQLGLDDPAALQTSENAYQLFRRYPHAPAADVAIAAAVRLEARAVLGGEIGPPAMAETWDALRRAPFAEMPEALAVNAAVFHLAYERLNGPGRHEAAARELAAWCGPELAGLIGERAAAMASEAVVVRPPLGPRDSG